MSALITEGYWFVDRTDRIALVEDIGKTLLFLRPRRFGKSLWLSVLENYCSGKASTIATDTAQVVLMDGSLSQLSYLFQLAHDLNTNMKTTLALTLGPGVICVGGVFFLHFGILSSVLLYNLSLVAGVTNAMRPWFQRQPQDSSRKDSQDDTRH